MYTTAPGRRGGFVLLPAGRAAAQLLPGGVLGTAIDGSQPPPQSKTVLFAACGTATTTAGKKSSTILWGTSVKHICKGQKTALPCQAVVPRGSVQKGFDFLPGSPQPLALLGSSAALPAAQRSCSHTGAVAAIGQPLGGRW